MNQFNQSETNQSSVGKIINQLNLIVTLNKKKKLWEKIETKPKWNFEWSNQKKKNCQIFLKFWD